MSIDADTRRQQFKWLKEHIPEEGSVLVALETDATVFKAERDGKTTKYVNACIDNDATGWFLSNEVNGLKCLITMRDHKKIGERVSKLRVIRVADNRKYLICELME